MFKKLQGFYNYNKLTFDIIFAIKEDIEKERILHFFFFRQRKMMVKIE